MPHVSVHMEHFERLLFKLMNHGTNTVHVVFIFLFSEYEITLNKYDLLQVDVWQ